MNERIYSFQSGSNVDGNHVIRVSSDRVYRAWSALLLFVVFLFLPNCPPPLKGEPRLVNVSSQRTGWVVAWWVTHAGCCRRDWTQLREHGQAENRPVFYQGRAKLIDDIWLDWHRERKKQEKRRRKEEKLITSHYQMLFSFQIKVIKSVSERAAPPFFNNIITSLIYFPALSPSH